MKRYIVLYSVMVFWGSFFTLDAGVKQLKVKAMILLKQLKSSKKIIECGVCPKKELCNKILKLPLQNLYKVRSGKLKKLVIKFRKHKFCPGCVCEHKKYE